MTRSVNRFKNTNIYRELFLGAIVVLGVASLLGGCVSERQLPAAMMPTPPKECQQVLDFKVEPLAPGKSTATALSVAMAKEGAARQQEHATSKVCAEYALRASGVMKDKEAPAEAKKGVDAATAVPPTPPPAPKRAPKKTNGDIKTPPPTPSATVTPDALPSSG